MELGIAGFGVAWTGTEAQELPKGESQIFPSVQPPFTECPEPCGMVAPSQLRRGPGTVAAVCLFPLGSSRARQRWRCRLFSRHSWRIGIGPVAPSLFPLPQAPPQPVLLVLGCESSAPRAPRPCGRERLRLLPAAPAPCRLRTLPGPAPGEGFCSQILCWVSL